MVSIALTTRFTEISDHMPRCEEVINYVDGARTGSLNVLCDDVKKCLRLSVVSIGFVNLVLV